jgi:hypothetical protein
MASITIQTGQVSGPVPAGGQFQWLNTGPNTCNVTKSPSNWDSGANPLPVPGGTPTNPGSVTVTATATPGYYSWSSPCCQLGSQRVGIGQHPKPAKKK